MNIYFTENDMWIANKLMEGCLTLLAIKELQMQFISNLSVYVATCQDMKKFNFSSVSGHMDAI